MHALYFVQDLFCDSQFMLSHYLLENWYYFMHFFTFLCYIMELIFEKIFETFLVYTWQSW